MHVLPSAYPRTRVQLLVVGEAAALRRLPRLPAPSHPVHRNVAAVELRTRYDGARMNTQGRVDPPPSSAIATRSTGGRAALDLDPIARLSAAVTSSAGLTPGLHSSGRPTRAASVTAFTADCDNDRVDDGQACERAVAAAEQRIGSALAGEVIRDLFGIGLTLEGTWPHVTEAGQPRLTAAIDGIDQVIRTIRDVVFALAPRTASSEGTAGAGDMRGQPARADRGVDDRP